MADPHVISALKAKRARLAGEINQAQAIVAQRMRELLAIDAVIRLFSPDTDPDMIVPIRPAGRRLFFRYQELSRLTMSILREAGKPLTLDQIADLAMEAKGFPPDDAHLRKHVKDLTRAGLLRMARAGKVRKIITIPAEWWELVGPKITLA